MIFKIAIFGLIAIDSDEIKKQILKCLPTETHIQWVTISDAKIDILFVHNSFFNTPGIQKVLKEKVRYYLRLSQNNGQFGTIIQDQLFFPIHRIEPLKIWLLDSLFGINIEAEMPQNEVIERIQPVNVRKSLEFNTSRSFVAIFSELLVSRNDYLQLFDAQGLIAIVDTRTERVWVDQTKINIQFDESLKHSYMPARLVNSESLDKNVYDLRVWLWPNITRLPNRFLPKIDRKKNFKLDIWPQFENNAQRRNNLKMAVCFESGANIEQVQQYLNLSDEIVLNFISYTHLLKLGRYIDASEVEFIFADRHIGYGQTNKLKGLFGKLRKKLGL
ncbi:hypothetical protein [Acinetobacter sp. MD2]|uniref:hypothetical protein n=1 Tax=Acinetobacter sp. MD2 TaxID=2600066 RepID=UPI002D787B8B|nr:hypothetical protein [Acinetobacter sp. MD2]